MKLTGLHFCEGTPLLRNILFVLRLPSSRVHFPIRTSPAPTVARMKVTHVIKVPGTSLSGVFTEPFFLSAFNTHVDVRNENSVYHHDLGGRTTVET